MSSRLFQQITRYLLTIGMLLATVLALAGPVTPAAAAGTITVNSLDDNLTPGDGNCTLNEAITNANSDADTTGGDCAPGSGTDTLSFSLSGTITLNSTLVLSDPAGLTIDGTGQAVTINGNNAVMVMKLDSGSALTLKDLTIAQGNGVNAGGIYNFNGTLTVINSAFLDNNSGFYGGGIFNFMGTVAVTDSTFSGNTAAYGGGIYSHAGELTVTGSNFSGNRAQFGGGISNENSVTLAVTGSTFSGNQARFNGGGIYYKVDFLAKPTIINSIFSSNSAGSNGGGIYYETQPLSILSYLTITGSTFSGNSAASNGGGIYNLDGESSDIEFMQITNSTFSGNTAGYGGGIYNDDSEAVVSSSTLSGNSASVSGGGIYFHHNNSVMDLVNSIVANSPSSGNCYTNSYIRDIGGNLSYPDTTCPGINADPMLAPLADNGGPTLTMALPANSPAVDAAVTSACPATDQRGVSRPQGAGCDIGAYENGAPQAEVGGPYLGAVNTAIQFDGGGSNDPDGDPLAYAWDFGDGNTGDGQMPSHSYLSPGIYTVCLAVNDGSLGSDPSCTIAVAYDPEGGFVTGGGWIDSPDGAYLADPTLTGKASFGFVSKFTKGASTPSGNTEFQFQAVGFNFHSESYDWLLVNQDGTNAQFKGSGMINGALDPNGNPYKFMLWAGDGSPDTFRMRIWWEDSNGAAQDVYDNGTQAISGGNIVVHNGN
jgi:predicted outer membrane repeat protein